MLLIVESDRGIGLSDPNNWNVGLFDRRRDEMILDTNLNLEGETSFRPKITFVD
jgi:hypothetical protein